MKVCAASAHPQGNRQCENDFPRSMLDQAIELLAQAERIDWFKSGQGLALLKTDADLNPLRQRLDFRALLDRALNSPLSNK